MFKKILVIITSILAYQYQAQGQTTYLQLGEEEYHLLDRLETRSGHLSDSLYLSTQPVSRKGAVSFWEHTLYGTDSAHLSAIDRHNIRHGISISGEWATDENGAIDSRHSWWHKFYKKQPDFLYVKTKDFFLSLNPVISFQAMSETYKTGDESKTQSLMSSSRGVELRGWVSKKIHFYAYIADNQEQPVSYVKNWIEQRQAVPGADYYQTPSTKTYDYLQAKGYIDFAIIKNYVSANFGYDKQFIGDGIRSLFWSDFSSNMPYLKLNTRIWKFNYQNLYSELTPSYIRGADQQLPHKYSTTHYLSINATKWLNVGLFENTIFARNDRYQFGYMMPIILFRAVERWNGSPDNVNLGLNVKAVIAKHVQVYGQLFLDEYQAAQLYTNKGWWGNKYGVQLGAKYFDAFGIRNLDLQGEFNMVRPYTYSHSDSTTNYSNYNQPLAHPLGSGFIEFIGVAKYQPIRDLYLTGKLMYYNKGVDTGGLNYGNDIFKSNNSFANEYGVKMINGLKSTCIFLNLNASYKLRERLFFDLGVNYRKYSYEGDYYPASTSTSIYGGFRLNIARRTYDMF